MPQPQANEVLIKMLYSSVSKPDYLMRTGNYPWSKDILPINLGRTGAGTVAALGSGLTEYKIGQPVYIESPVTYGCNSEYKTATLQDIMPVPEGASLEHVAAIANSLHAWAMLTETCGDGTGKTLYISGAAGSFGTAVLQMAPLLGFTVIASASSEKKCAYLRDQGASHVFNYKKNDPVQQVRQVTQGKGADIILDQVAGRDFCRQFEMLADFGTIVVYNHLGGFPEENIIQAMTSRFANCHAIRIYSSHIYDDKPELLAQKKKEVFQLLSEKKISPHIGARFPLNKAADAHAMLDSGDFFGSIILDLQG
jgi:NADPH2:quinone reductase